MDNKVYQMVTARIIEQMDKGIIPWHKPWHIAGGTEEMAINYVSRKPYSTLNQWLLLEPGEYLTFTQIKALKGNIKKGAKSRFVVFYTQVPYEKTDEETGEKTRHSYPLLRYYNVFRLADCEGIQSKLPAPGEAPEMPEAPVCGEADAAIDEYVASQPTLVFRNDRPSDRAYYSPAEDKVVVPMRSQFDDMAEYYSTAFHELTHSTLTESRCNRKKDGAGASFFGTKSYSREELVAEMGAAMLCSNFGVDTARAFRNSVAYLQSWADNLKGDPKAIVFAASRAEKAARYILGERTNVEPAKA